VRNREDLPWNILRQRRSRPFGRDPAALSTSKSWRYRYPENTRAIGLARIRRDRFLGQYANIEGGWLLSREVKVTGNRLVINCSPEHRAFSRGPGGSWRVGFERMTRCTGSGSFLKAD